MALIGTNRGVNGEVNTITTYAFSPTADLAAGSFAILCLTYRNSGAAGADQGATVSDTIGNTWTSRIASLNDPGAAGAGNVLRIFTSTVSTLPASAVVTVTFGATTNTKIHTLTEVKSDASGGSVIYVTGNSSSGASPTTQTITTTSIGSGNLVLGCLGQLSTNSTGGTHTADTDTVNGSWSTMQDFATSSGGREIISQFKVTTAAGTQTYNPIATPINYYNLGWVEVSESITASTSSDPMGMMGFFGI